ncbi:intraflagellar transport protein 27 homolog [Styela clava]|uniref:intraflagellar transport protein 27 homolog n=1 Tax=Styela clava TaxID=7725 RepID=UPI001939D34B|nr:intraflagellar transport protein 27 homolog [Styela clava]
MGVLRAKCVIVGDCTVGKSAITQVFHSDGTMFPKNYTMTTGVEVCQKVIPVRERGDFVDIFMFDSAGKDVFSEICEKHWDDIGMLAVVFDVTDIESLNRVKNWRNKMKEHINPEKNIPSVLIGNKVDLDLRRQVTTEEGEELAEQLGMTYFEVSAKGNEGIEAPFQYLAQKFADHHQDSRENVQMLE